MTEKNSKNPVKCPNCNSNNIVKKGIRKNKLKTFQQYQCKSCSYIFKQNPSKNKTYPIQTILKTIKEYNLGYSLNQVKQKLKTKATLPTISNWLKEYKNICTYSKLRKEAIKIYQPKEIIEQHQFLHNNLPYKFQIHKAKLYLLFHNIKYNNQFTNISKFYEPIKTYLNKIPTKQFPHHIFKQHKQQSSEAAIAQIKNNSSKNNQSPDAKIAKINNIDNILEQRASQLKLKTLKIKRLLKNNLANKLTSLALNLTNSNKQRHEIIQNFFIINDSTTIAAEIPVYLTNDDIKYFKKRNFKINIENYTTPITGHIDILQIRNGLIHILDYKPEARKQNPINQLTIYALALASRTKLAIKDFKCAWFDENNCFEFYPLHTVYKNYT